MLGVERHRRRKASLTRATRRLVSSEAQIDQEQGARVYAELRHYPRDSRLLPTMLGNTLRAAEDLSGARYGLSAYTVFPRLYGLVEGPLKEEFDGLRDQYDTAARLAVSLALSSIASSILLVYASGYVGLLALGGLTLAWLSYRSAVEAAGYYGDLLLVVFDLHRFDLLAQLCVPLPRNPSKEYRLNQRLTAFFEANANKDRFPVHSYAHTVEKVGNADPGSAVQGG